jgi:hypothetical protein
MLRLHTGAAYVFTRPAFNSTWSEEQKLTAPDGGINDHFGVPVSVSDGVIAVGAGWDDDKGSEAGGL